MFFFFLLLRVFPHSTAVVIYHISSGIKRVWQKYKIKNEKKKENQKISSERKFNKSNDDGKEMVNYIHEK